MQAALGTIQFTSFSAFLKSWWALLRPKSHETHIEPIFMTIVAGYFVMMWQWVAYVAGWPTLFATRRLWAVSSAYFIGVALALLYLGYQQQLTRLEDFLVWAVVACLVPCVFLGITVPLWLSTPPPDPY
jgi:hypothetical protein